MRIAVITPCHNTPEDLLVKCHRSVMAQTIRCSHILVDDGSTPSLEQRGAPPTQVIRLPRAHADTGNAARAIGSVSAISQGYDAIAYLDSDNWYEPTHLESLVEAHRVSGAPVCTSSRNLYTPEGTLLGRCPEVDGERFVDTSCMLFTKAAFQAVALWYLVPPHLKLRGDRFVWDSIVHNNMSRAHTGQPTVAYRTLYRYHYEHFGVPPPEGAKELVVKDGRFVSRST